MGHKRLVDALAAVAAAQHAHGVAHDHVLRVLVAPRRGVGAAHGDVVLLRQAQAAGAGPAGAGGGVGGGEVHKRRVDLALRVGQQVDGAVGRLLLVWRQAARAGGENQVAHAYVLHEALAAVGQRHLRVGGRGRAGEWEDNGGWRGKADGVDWAGMVIGRAAGASAPERWLGSNSGVGTFV